MSCILTFWQVGKGLSKDAKAQKLAFQHWIEAIDPRHRYGHNLNLYYEEWCKRDTVQPLFLLGYYANDTLCKTMYKGLRTLILTELLFHFYFILFGCVSSSAYMGTLCCKYSRYLYLHRLDIGEGKEVNLKDCPRSRPHQECIKYLGPQERKQYQYIIVGGKFVHKQTGNLLNTNHGLRGSKWIFVMSASKTIYAGEKQKGIIPSFQLPSWSGHFGSRKTDGHKMESSSLYQHTVDITARQMRILVCFLAFLKENEINVDEVKVFLPSEDNESSDTSKYGDLIGPEAPKPQVSSAVEKKQTFKSNAYARTGRTISYRRTLSSNLQNPRTSVQKKEILQRIQSKKEASSYQLGNPTIFEMVNKSRNQESGVLLITLRI
ncbi:hypothetical protein Patl1_05919 [Pistacia atlantica]|uniref:Uncharacterized protein n=1 Tax=Pistacia atlantica TaxID=434234 RepID=A0ACC1BRM8_9ROSI|nr:hypothetical protein Patl1_05919 [Pistacia atlantica]